MIRHGKFVLLPVMACVLLAGVHPLRAQIVAKREVIDKDVDRAIARTVRWIYGRQLPDGSWPNHTGVHHGGPTAMALFALLEAGENEHNEDIARGVEALVKGKDDKYLYMVAMRIMVLSQMGGQQNEKYAKVFKEDLDWLTKNAANLGAWTYSGASREGDNSCSQFALLALWEATRANEEVNLAIIRAAERSWLARQKPDGGWTYAGTFGTKGESTPSMAAAGVASLYVCQDAIIGGDCRPYPHVKPIERGLEYLSQNLKDDYQTDGYLAFCVQRVGLASGLKFLGNKDWYTMGALEMVKPQPYGAAYRGQWGPDVRAAFELIFLARGRTPLVFNKLAYGDTTNWNSHPRDIARFSEYMRRNFERRMRWQVVNIQEDIRMLLDAPILLVTGNKALEFTDEQWAKLREYSLRGGMLLFMPSHVNVPFVNGVKEKLATLYAEQQKQAPGKFELIQLKDDGPMYNAYKPVENGVRKTPLWGVSDGTRIVALLGEQDLGCSWQRYLVRGKPEQFALGVNMYMYATGANDLGSRMRPVFVGSDRPARETVKVAWLKHGGNWNTQPHAFDYLSQKLTAENFVKIDLKAGVVPGKDPLDDYALLWLTGTDEVKFTDAQVAALRGYLDQGGTIYANAIGGSADFVKSIDQLVMQLSAGRNGSRFGPPDAAPLMSGKLGEHRGLPLEKLKRTRNWKLKDPRGEAPFQIYEEGGHPRVIISTFGVHDTLDGHTAWSAMSFMPEDAGQIAANVVLYAMMEKPIPPGPSTQPDEAATQPDEEPAPIVE